MQIKVESNCPLDKFKPCRTNKCAWFTQIRGHNPNTGQEVDEWGCAIAWLPLLQVETATRTRQTSAAVDSFRNEVAKSTEENLQQLASQFGPLLESK